MKSERTEQKGPFHGFNSLSRCCCSCSSSFSYVQKKQPNVSGLQVFFGCFCMGHSEGKFPKKKVNKSSPTVPRKTSLNFSKLSLPKPPTSQRPTCERPMSPTSCFCVKNAAREDFTKQPKMVILKVEWSSQCGMFFWNENHRKQFQCNIL